MIDVERELSHMKSDIDSFNDDQDDLRVNYPSHISFEAFDEGTGSRYEFVVEIENKNQEG